MLAFGARPAVLRAWLTTILTHNLLTVARRYGTDKRNAGREVSLQDQLEQSSALLHRQLYVTVRAGNTKSKQDTRVYVQRELAELLKAHIATKAPGAKVFAMPSISNVARMLHEDLGAPGGRG